MNFLRTHLISKIESLVITKQRTLKSDGFFYFDEDIKDPRVIINRINRWNVFPKEQILPVSWYMLEGQTLIKIFDMIKKNQFYAYKQIDKKDYKIRIKDDNTRSRL